MTIFVQEKYVQRFSDNLNIIHEPSITKGTENLTLKSHSSLIINVLVFLSNNLTPEMLSLFKRRIYDIAAVTDSKVIVKLNGQPVQVKTFMNYVEMYIGNKVCENVHMKNQMNVGNIVFVCHHMMNLHKFHS